MGEAHALRLAGGPGGVGHDRDVVGPARGHRVGEEVRVRVVMRAAEALDALVGVQEVLRVVAQPARVVEDDVLELRAAVPDLQHLVDLLLVLDDGEVDVGVVQHVDHLLGHRVLVERHRDAAQRLRRGHRPVQARAVVADDREVHPALEAERGQPAGERAHLLGDLRPGPGLPDAEVLLARGRVVAAHLRVVQQQAREHIQFQRRGRRWHGVLPPSIVGGPVWVPPSPRLRAGWSSGSIL